MRSPDFKIGQARQNLSSEIMITPWVFCLWKMHTRLVILTHWGGATHLCVSKLTIVGADNGLSPGRRQATIGTSAGIMLIGSLGTNFNEILIEILTFSFKKMRLKVSSAKWWRFCLGLNVLRIASQKIIETLFILETPRKSSLRLCGEQTSRSHSIITMFIQDHVGQRVPS